MRTFWQLTPLVAGLLMITTGLLSQEPEEVTVRGRVLDASGKPLPGAAVSDAWRFDGGEFSARQLVTAGAEGRFELTRKLAEGQRHFLMALDPARRLGGFASFTSESGFAALEIRLRPLQDVNGRLLSKEVPFPPDRLEFVVSAQGAEHALVRGVRSDSRVHFALPPGEYRLSVGGSQSFVGRTIDYKLDGASIDLGDIALDGTPIGKSTGKTPPALSYTEARHLPPGAPRPGQLALSDFKGRWLALQFWGPGG